MSNTVSRRQSVAVFSAEVADGLVTHLMPADEVLDQHPLLAQARRHWRANIETPKPFCFACRRVFANASGSRCAFVVVPEGAANSCTVSALCTTCWRDLTDSEIERAALRVMRRLKPGFRFKDAE